jgi:hypothetical protein
MRSLILISLTLFLFPVLFAEDKERPDRPAPEGRERGDRGDRRSPEGRERGDRRDRDGMKSGQRMRMFLEKIKKENPQLHERLLKLKDEDPEKFREEAFKVMRKTMAEHGHRKAGSLMEKYKKENPEKYEKLMALRKSDPEKFREGLSQVIGKQLRGEHKGKDGEKHKAFAEIRKMVADYKNAPEEEKESMKADLKAKVQESIKKDLASQVERAERMEKYLSTIKKQIEERQENMDKYVDERLERILNSDFKPKGGERKGPGHKGRQLEKRDRPDGVERP